MHTGIVARVADRVCETEKVIAFVILPGEYAFEIKDSIFSSKNGQINRIPKVERRDKSSERLPNPNGLINKRIMVAAPNELSESGFRKIKFPKTIIT